MIFLLFCISSSILIAFLLKMYSEKDIPINPIIIWNYPFCAGVGLVGYGKIPTVSQFTTAPWFEISIGMGLVFLLCFLAIGKSYQVAGLMLTSVMQRMSMLVTLLFAYFVFQQSLNAIQLFGIALALVAIVLINYEKRQIKPHWSTFAFPLSVLMFSGIIDSTFYYVQHTMPVSDPLFIIAIFLFAGFFGIFYLWYLQQQGEQMVSYAILKAAFWIGACNFSSGFFLLEAIRTIKSPLVFPINHLAILSVNALLALLYFKEKSNPQKIVGLIFAFVAITLIFIAK